MVPFHPISGPESLAKKRKWNDQSLNEKTYTKVEGTKSIFDIELHLETPLPLDWQRCLDIQSGKIHFYNTKTQKRTSRDPRDDDIEEEENDQDEMSLDLKLNLTCESMEKNMNQRQNRSHNLNMSLFGSREDINNNDHNEGVIMGGHEKQRQRQKQEEMVAAVCMRCHLLVMLCKSSPECPNCKFMHSPEQTPSTPTPNPTPMSLFKRRCSLSWVVN